MIIGRYRAATSPDSERVRRENAQGKVALLWIGGFLLFVCVPYITCSVLSTKREMAARRLQDQREGEAEYAQWEAEEAERDRRREVLKPFYRDLSEGHKDGSYAPGDQLPRALSHLSWFDDISVVRKHDDARSFKGYDHILLSTWSMDDDDPTARRIWLRFMLDTNKASVADVTLYFTRMSIDGAAGHKLMMVSIRHSDSWEDVTMGDSEKGHFVIDRADGDTARSSRQSRPLARTSRDFDATESRNPLIVQLEQAMSDYDTAAMEKAYSAVTDSIVASSLAGLEDKVIRDTTDLIRVLKNSNAPFAGKERCIRMLEEAVANWKRANP